MINQTSKLLQKVSIFTRWKPIHIELNSLMARSSFPVSQSSHEQGSLPLCEYLIFPGNSGYAEQVLTGNVHMHMQMCEATITKYIIQTPQLRANGQFFVFCFKKRRSLHLFGCRSCNSCTNHILCASGRKRLVSCIYHISAQQSHQTGLLRSKCRWCESLCDSVRDRISLERTQTGWQRAGGEARLSLAASSSLAAHTDFFSLSPPCVAAVGLRCVF